MGTGIAITFATAGIPVVVVDANDEQLEKARQTVFGMFYVPSAEGPADPGTGLDSARSSITFTDDYAELADADVVVEAVFENMDVKKTGLRQARRDRSSPTRFSHPTPRRSTSTRWRRPPSAPTGASACTSSARPTSCRCSRSCAARTPRRRRFATAFELGKQLRKFAVLSGNAFGFIGNRMFFDYAREAIALAKRASRRRASMRR